MQEANDWRVALIKASKKVRENNGSSSKNLRNFGKSDALVEKKHKEENEEEELFNENSDFVTVNKASRHTIGGA